MPKNSHCRTPSPTGVETARRTRHLYILEACQDGGAPGFGALQAAKPYLDDGAIHGQNIPTPKGSNSLYRLAMPLVEDVTSHYVLALASPATST